MNLRSRKQKLVAEINITPFTDVILVLLIIFMITTPLILQSNIKVNLPSAASGKPVESARNQVEVTITNENVVYLDGKVTTKRELKEKITSYYRNNSRLAVILLSDKMVKFKDVVSILDVLNDVGVQSLNIMARQEQ